MCSIADINWMYIEQYMLAKWAVRHLTIKDLQGVILGYLPERITDRQAWGAYWAATHTTPDARNPRVEMCPNLCSGGDNHTQIFLHYNDQLVLAGGCWDCLVFDHLQNQIHTDIGFQLDF